MKTVDFVIANPRHHLDMVVPVVKWLRENSSCRPRVVSICELRGFVTPRAAIENVGARVEQACRVRFGKSSRVSARARTTVKGKSRKAVHALTWRFVIRWPKVHEREPSLAVLPNDSSFPYDRIIALYKSARVPVLLQQEGIRFPFPDDWEGRRYGDGGADAVAAWGEHAASYFRSVGVPQERIHRVGNPRLDKMFATDWQATEHATLQSLGLKKPYLLFVSNPIDQQGFCTINEKHALFARLLSTVRPLLQETGYTLAVKLHGAEDPIPYQTLISAADVSSSVQLLPTDAALYPLMRAAKATMVLASTAGLESMLLGTPVGVLPLPNGAYAFDYVSAGAAVPLTYSSDLTPYYSLLEDSSAIQEARQRFLQHHVANPGGATQATGKLILDLLGGEK